MDGFYVNSLKFNFTTALKRLVGNGLVFNEGEERKLKRKIMSQVFNYDFIKSKIGLITKITQRIIAEVEAEEINKDSKEVKMDFAYLCRNIFGNVVVKSYFGDI